MNSTNQKKKCFVIMPFGEKENIDGRVIDFDKIYNFFIKNTIESLGLACVRCDEIAEAGWIHSKMFEHIYKSEVAIADITSLNPNVMYELGVRHSVAEFVTVIIRMKGTAIPFNIQGFQIIEYDPQDLESVEAAKKKMVDFIRNGLALRKKDSPVHEILNLKIRTESKQLDKTSIFSYQLRKLPDKQICLVTGDIRNARGIDIWVSSENTNMQMARHFDRSISSVIRYQGAKKDLAGQVAEDTIANELATAMGNHYTVPPATVIVTGAGELERTNNVKRIFHAASVVGQVGMGYTPIADIGMCVRNALEKASSDEFRDVQLRSILFPLMGTGTGRGMLEEKAKELIYAAISFLEASPHCAIEKVYFLAWSDTELEVCQRILQEAPEVIVG